MAKEVAISKRLKISEAEQYMILAVLAAGVVLGVAASLVYQFVQQIAFNSEVIAKEEQSIVSYTEVIKNTGVCKSPKGNIYTDEELENCDPSSIETSEVPGSLRAEILENLAANEALNSVAKENDTDCQNPETGKSYTYDELEEIYDAARGSEELQNAVDLMKSCSALRIIPDALPNTENQEALLASLNKLFLVSDWEPESLSPSGEIEVMSDIDENLNAISVSLSVEADAETTTKVLNNIEKSIREFDVQRATIEWSSNGELILQASANAYYVNESAVAETTETLEREEEEK